MNPEDNFYTELIEPYLDNTLSAIERSLMEEKILRDPNFAMLVKQHRLAQDLIIERGLLELKQKIRDGKYGDAPKGGSTRILWSLTVLLLAGTGTYWFCNMPSKTGHTAAPTEKTAALTTSEKPVYIRPSAQVHEKNTTPKPKAEAQRTDAPAIHKEEQATKPLPLFEEKTKQEVFTVLTPQNVIAEKTLEPSTLPMDLPVKTAKSEKKEHKEASSTTPESLETQERDDQEYLFNPSLGQVWNIPNIENQNARLTIMGKSGELLYNIQITQGQPDSWNGQSNSGMEIPMGSYPFIITYEQGKVVQGYVAVQR